jgi:DNA repair protein SbcC/Rad50
MRPLRLLLDGFGSYREAAEADFTGVDFFALVGPTGSGKSTVIDGLCFALYGTVPRWGKENVIAQALAPAANACRVALIFELGGKRYAAVRALTRTARGQVQTKEARLELLDPAVPADASLTELLEASVEQLAEGPDQVKSAVQQLLGLTYEHFTQSVLLPQGRFSEFLHAKAADRQNLLVELLAFGVYDTVGKLARDRAKLAAELAQQAKSGRAALADASAEAETAAAERAESLAGFGRVVEERLAALRELRAQAAQADKAVQTVRAELALLAPVRTPADLPGLAKRISEADQLVAQRRADRDRLELTEVEAGQARDDLPDKAQLERVRDAYAEQRDLAARIAKLEQVLTDRRAEADAAQAALTGAETRLERSQAALASAERAHAAVAVAAHLHVGEDCPVCLQPVTVLPQHSVPADLATATSAAEAAAADVKKARAAHDQAQRSANVAAGNVENTTDHSKRIAVQLADTSSEPEIRGLLEAIAVADDRLAKARVSSRAGRDAVVAAEKQRASLEAEERRAQADLHRARDSVVQLGAPPAEADLAAAWESLTSWATAEGAGRRRRLLELEAATGADRAQVMQAEVGLADLLVSYGITDVADVERAEAAVAAHRERALHRLDLIKANRAKAVELDAQLKMHTEAEQVASMLGRLLRATSFERWLCGEALDSLVAEASQTLMELSGGQYQLDRDERNDLVVIDYQDAGARRPVHTLSGGETFQASLALALALSRQVIGLSAGMRDLNSMFLDEGFGTLDEDTLEVVGSTLERLSTDSDRMIGIITHVPALAERAQVRFVVSRAGTTSTLRRESVA